jgi:polyphosphate kinase 2 (PPK2 family)
MREKTVGKKAIRAAKEMESSGRPAQDGRLKRRKYEAVLDEMHMELVKMQYWVRATGEKLAVLFEGCDAAGKGGAIKCVAEPLPSWVVHSLDLIQVGKDLQWTKQRQCRNRNRPSRVGGASSR